MRGWPPCSFTVNFSNKRCAAGWGTGISRPTAGRRIPALVLYFVGFFLLITGCAAMVNRLMRLKSGEIVVLLGVVNFLWLGGMVFGYALQNVFVI